MLFKVLSTVFVMAFLSATGYASSTEAKKACQHTTEDSCKADTKSKCAWTANKCEMKDHGAMKHGDMNHGEAKSEAGKDAAGHEAAPSKEHK